MAHVHVEDKKLSNFEFLNKMFFDHNVNRYGIISILLLFVGCGGGIAVGLGALEHVVELVLLVLSTMTALAMILAVAPMRTIVFTSILAVVIDIFVITYNLIA